MSLDIPSRRCRCDETVSSLTAGRPVADIPLGIALGPIDVSSGTAKPGIGMLTTELRNWQGDIRNISRIARGRFFENFHHKTQAPGKIMIFGIKMC
jgi:hypothetical protein